MKNKILYSSKKKERKERIINITRQDIYNAVVKIVESGGFDEITMDIVAYEVGISKGTLYKFFKSKNDLMEWVEYEALEPVMMEVESILRENLQPDEKIKEMSKRVFNYFLEKRELFRFLLLDRHIAMMHIMRRNDTRYRRMVDKITLVVEEGISKGIFKGFSPKKIAIMIIEANIALKEAIILDDCCQNIEEEMNFIYDVIFYGIMRQQ